MSSGVGVNDESLKAFNEFKLGGGKKDPPNYIIYRISDDKTEIIIDKKGRTETYDEFTELLPENECRFAVYDFDYELPGGAGKRAKIIFYTWAPDTTPIRNKMVYATSHDALRRALNGVAVDIQGADYSEIDYDTVFSKVTRGTN